MKQNGLSSALLKVIIKAARAKGRTKTHLFIRYFREDEDMVRIHDSYHAKQYPEALRQLISYIQSRRHILHLTCCMLRRGFVNTYINDYKGSGNPAAIRCETQLVSLFNKLPAKGKREAKKTLSHLIKRAKKNKSFLLLMDEDTDSRILFRELIHELNAWLYSGCAEPRENLSCMIGDWRMRLLDHNGHRDLDAYFLKKQNKPNPRISKQKLKANIVELVHILSESGLLQTLVPLQKKESKHAYMYFSAARRPGGEEKKPILSYGVSFYSRELAMIKCLSELLERISFQWNNIVSLKTVLSRDLRSEGYFSEYIRGKDREKKGFGCIEGEDISSGKKVHIPAQFVYTGYLKSHSEDVISPFTGMGSGVAAGIDRSTVLMNAVYELVERDALMTGYLHDRKPDVIDQETIGVREIRRIFRRLTGQRLQVEIFDITNDLEIPTYLSLLTTGTSASFVAGGVKSNRNPASALYGALEESYLEWVIKTDKKERLGSQKTRPAGASAELILTYERFRPLITGILKRVLFVEPGIHSQTSKKELEETTGNLYQKGHRILYTDITPGWLTGGYKVYRVFIPSLQPLFFTRNEEWINRQRLREARRYFDSYTKG